MNDWGWKVMKEGKSASSTDLRDLLVNSSFNMFKYHLDTTASMTINAGDSTKTITIPHNLGYVPAFLTYQGDSDYIKMLPNRKTPAFTGIDEHWYSYADSTNIYIKWDSVIPYNHKIYTDSDTYNDDLGRGYTGIGNYGGALGTFDCAIRFTGISINRSESISSVTLDFYALTKGSNDDVKFKTYGIDEDNTSDFGSYPLGRTTTSANTSQTQSSASVPFSFGINVLSQFNEIRQRSGWSVGNAMGFLLFNNGTNTGAYFQGVTSYNKLTIVKSGSISYSFRILVFKDKITD